MRGMDIALESLAMRGTNLLTAGTDVILNEARRLMDVRYFRDGEGKGTVMFGPYNGWDEFKRLSVFLVSNFDEGYSVVAKFKEGDLVEANNRSWKYGIVRKIVTTWSSPADPKHFGLSVSTGVGKVDTVYYESLKENMVRIASLPPEIIDLAKYQLMERCPLIGGEHDRNR